MQQDVLMDRTGPMWSVTGSMWVPQGQVNQLGAETSEDPEIIMDRGVLKHGHKDTQTFHYYHMQASWSEERDEGAFKEVGKESLKGWAFLQEVQFSLSVMSHSLRLHGLPCPSPTPRAYSNSCPLSQWCHLFLCRPLLLPPSIFPSIRVFPKGSVLHIRWPKYGSFSFSISPSNEYSGLISFRIDWFDLLGGGKTNPSITINDNRNSRNTIDKQHEYENIKYGLWMFDLVMKIKTVIWWLQVSLEAGKRKKNKAQFPFTLNRW